MAETQFPANDPKTTVATPESPSAPIARSPRRPPLPLILAGLLVIGGGVFLWRLVQPAPSRLEISGRLEGYETDIGVKIGGRINFVAVREGDAVKTNQVLVRLDDAEIQAQLRGAQARLNAIQQQQQQAKWQIDVVRQQIQEAKLNLEVSQGDQQGRIAQAESNVAATQAQLAQVKAQLNLAKANRDRAAQLVKDGAVSQQQFDQAETTFESAQATVAALQKQVTASQGALTLAQTSRFNPDIRNSQLTALEMQQQRATAQLAAAQSEVQNARAAVQQIQAQIAYLNVVSPLDGVVTARSVEPGAVVTTGKTVLSVIDLNTVYLRGFVPEGDMGKIRVGQAAKVCLDSPDRAPGLSTLLSRMFGSPPSGCAMAPANKVFEAEVAAIDPQASFTPENIYFRDDRVKQVFGVKLKIRNPGGFAKPGMPADAEILLGEGK